MPKKIMSDMVPKGTTHKRSTPKNHGHSHSHKTTASFERAENKKIEERFEKLSLAHHKVNYEPLDNSGEKGKKHTGLWFVALISIVVLFLTLSSNFSSAKVTVTPKSHSFVVDQLFGATKGGTLVKDIPFELVSMEGEETTVVTGTTEQEMSLPARGSVVIYNNYSSAPQKLSIDTRLEGSNGKIYKTDKEITVPGMSGTTPGSIEVGVYAYEPGEAYNSGPLDFKILGFRGTGKYEKFYARSTGDISGGISGKFFVVSEAERTAVYQSLTQKLQENLTKKVLEQVPEDYVLFKEALIFKEGTSNVLNPQKEASATVSVRGSVYGFLFKKSDLVSVLASLSIKDYDGKEVFIPNIENLTFTFGNRDNLSPELRSFNFKLSGNGEIVYKLDEAKIAEQLVSREKSEFKNVLAENTEIDSAELVLRPVWRSQLPDKLSRINVLVNYPE